MKEVITINNDYIFFQGKIKSALKVNGWTNADLAKEIGYSHKSVEAFMSKNGRKSEAIANSIAKALKIER